MPQVDGTVPLYHVSWQNSEIRGDSLVTRGRLSRSHSSLAHIIQHVTLFLNFVKDSQTKQHIAFPSRLSNKTNVLSKDRVLCAITPWSQDYISAPLSSPDKIWWCGIIWRDPNISHGPFFNRPQKNESVSVDQTLCGNRSAVGLKTRPLILPFSSCILSV